MLGPVIRHSLGLNLNRPKNIIRKSRLERSRKDTVIRALDPERPGVRLLLDIHPPVAIVRQANGRAVASLTGAIPGSDVYGVGQRVRERFIESVEA